MSFADYNDQNNWNTFKFIINGFEYVMPGISRVDVNRSRAIKKNKADGADGETVIDEGGNAATISLSVDMKGWEYDIFVNEIVPAIDFKGAMGKEKNPIKVDHPQCQAFSIQSVLIDSISSPAPSLGRTTISINMTEVTIAKEQKKPSATKYTFKSIPKPGIDKSGPSQSTYGTPLTQSQQINQVSDNYANGSKGV